MDQLDQTIAWENGELDDADAIKLFADLIKTGLVWSLQGVYGRTAAALIDAGYISKSGDILKEV